MNGQKAFSIETLERRLGTDCGNEVRSQKQHEDLCKVVKDQRFAANEDHARTETSKAGLDPRERSKEFDWRT
jgi:hypothetical protein